MLFQPKYALLQMDVISYLWLPNIWALFLFIFGTALLFLGGSVGSFTFLCIFLLSTYS